MTNKVVIPAKVFEELNSISDTSMMNMKDYRALKELSFNLGLHTTHEWLHNNMKLFQQGTIFGMEAEDK